MRGGVAMNAAGYQAAPRICCVIANSFKTLADCNIFDTLEFHNIGIERCRAYFLQFFYSAFRFSFKARP